MTRLKALEAEWEARFRLEPKLPTAALLTGAMAMACGFGAAMFLLFAIAMHFQHWTLQVAIFTALALALGGVNRYFARQWFKKVEAWSAEREQVRREMEALRAGTDDPKQTTPGISPALSEDGAKGQS